MLTNADVIHLLNQFNQALKDCRNVYLRAAGIVGHQYSDQLSESSADYTQRMDELHRGLLVKLYTTICGVDFIWSDVEEKMAGVLIFHLWQQSLNARQIRKAIKTMVADSEALTWPQLMEPFQRFPLLRECWPDLEASVMQIGNLLAKCDGNPSVTELEELKGVQRELLGCFHRSPKTSRKSPTAETEKTGAGAIAQQKQTSTGESVTTAPADAGVTLSQDALPQLMESLHELIGMAKVKSEVQTLINFIKFRNLRAGAGLPQTNLSLHMVFTGNPGTGKTTVARLLGQIYGAMGVLSRGHLVETDRSGLVAEYAGQTGPKTNKIIDQALDGILFIDEAYSLIAEASEDPYGHEAVQALLKRMEDDRHRLVVILAGYPKPIERMLRSNPGLSSRFSRHVHFEDYLPRELGQIFGAFCRQNHFTVHPLAQVVLMLGLSELYAARNEHFGNGRLVRNIFEKAVRNMSNRVVDTRELTRELLTEFHGADIEIDGVAAEKLKLENVQSRKVLVVCDQCQSSSRLAQKAIGKTVRCKSCQHRFKADWCLLE